MSRIIEHDKRHGKTYRITQGKLPLTVEVLRSFLEDPRGWWKHKFFEKRQPFPWRKKLPFFISPVIDCDKPQGTICKGPKSSLTFTVEVIRSFLWEIGCWKHKLLKKGNQPSEEKILAYFIWHYRVWQNSGAKYSPKISRQLLGKLQDHFCIT